jgi:hypothetical protein
MKLIRRNIVVATLAVVVGCGGERAAFRPTENVTRSAPGGRPAASYEIRNAPDQPAHAKVNVWSRGAWEEGGRTWARVALEVLNTGGTLVSLDTSGLRLDAFTNRGERLPPAQLVSTTSPNARLDVAANETGMIQLEYVIDANVKPDDLGSMRLRWAINHDDGRQYVQFTDFRRVREQYAYTGGTVFYDPIWGYYDPFLYGPPYGYHLRYRYPVGRTIHRDDGGKRTVIRDHR